MTGPAPSAPCLGILQLQNTPMEFIGCLGNPRTFRYPVRYRKVPGAWVSNVVPGDPAVEPAFVESARALAAEGASAITTTCGFALRHQAAIAAGVTVPVATSSLLLLPGLLAMTAPGAAVGVLTFDSRHIGRDLLALVGAADDPRVAIAGVEGSETWQRMSAAEVAMTAGLLTRDVLAAVARLRAERPGLSALLFECAGFGPVSAAARRETGLPVYDAVTNADLLMAGAAGQPIS